MDLGSGLQICPYYARCIHQFTYRGSTKENDSRHSLITPRPPRVKHKAVAVRNVPLVHFYFLFRPCPKPNAGPKPNADPKPNDQNKSLSKCFPTIHQLIQLITRSTNQSEVDCRPVHTMDGIYINSPTKAVQWKTTCI